MPGDRTSGGTATPPCTLEDLFQDTGNSFQAAIGLLNFEGGSGDSAQPGFGLAIDDMFVEWFEFQLVSDVTSCATGQCAVLGLPAGLLYEGVTSIPVSLLDGSPYGFACVGGPSDGGRCFPAHGNSDCLPGSCQPAENDCDFDGLFNGVADSDDCDGDGTPDLVALATSAVDFGESVVLNRVEGDSGEYRGTLAVSVLADNEGVLFLSQIGEALPTITVTYDDNDDGTGMLCQNGLNPDNQGRVQAVATVNIQACNVQVVATSFTDNGDGDRFADSSETISLDFDIQNNCGFLLTNCVARLSSNSPEVECIKQGTVVLGDLQGGGSGGAPIVSSQSSFVFKLDDVVADRTARGLGPHDPLNADFNIALSCDQIDGVQVPQNLTMSLDLNFQDDGQVPTPWLETFEGGGGNPADPFQGTQFEAQNNDQGIPGNNNAEGLINGDGWRCQYTDPDWVNSASYNQETGQDCFPGNSLAQADAVFWQIDGLGIPGTPDGGRAKSGSRSMYYGIFLNDPADDFTTPLSIVEAAGTPELINLGLDDPRLSFWHQISLADHRTIQAADRRSADRGALQIKLFDEGGAEASPWMNLQAIQNGYDEQNADNFFNCEFDPVDDGNTEDDFFDPTDPDRDSGPSSTCFPEFTWAWMGSTTGAFNVANVGHATTPPASSDAPSHGDGTWIETVVDLSRFRGRRAKLRFIVTGIKASYDTHGQGNPWGDANEGDDGWWIDDLTIDQVLAAPAFVFNDDYRLGTCSVEISTPCIAQCEFTGISCGNDSQCGVNELCLAPCPAPQTCLPVPPACGAVCNVVTANAFVTPLGVINPGTVATAAPGQVLTLNGAAPIDVATGATPSSADACLSGNLQFQFCRDGDPLGGGPSIPDGDCLDPEDLLIRAWTENAVLTLAPRESAGYTMQVRCSTKQDCIDSEIVEVDVTCPGADNGLGLGSLFAVFDEGDGQLRLGWRGSALDVDVWVSGGYTNTSALANYPGTTSSLSGVNAVDLDVLAPGPGEAIGVLVKADGSLNTVPVGFFCNSRTWRSGGVSELPESGTSGIASLGRDASIGDPTP